MSTEEKPLSELISSIDQVEGVVQSEQESSEKKPEKKKSKGFVIVVSILLFLILGIGGYYVYNQYFSPEEEIEQEEETENESLIDVSAYTDVRLKNYQDLIVEISEESVEYGLVSGIVVYSREIDDYEFETMSIINKKVLVGQDEQEAFLEAVNDIKEGNLEASWLTIGAQPSVLTTVALGTPSFDPLAMVKDFQFPNTDYSFALLSLSHGHEYASADSTSENYNIHIFAIKGDNIIRIESVRGNLIKDFGLTEEENLSCSEMTTDFTETDENYLTYNVECLSDIFRSGSYDTRMLEVANDLAAKFELAEQENI